MPFVLENHWTVKVKGARKAHLAPTGPDGTPLEKTLCGKSCTPDERLSSSRRSVATGDECAACMKAFSKALDAVYQLGIDQKMTREDASARAIRLLGMKIAGPQSMIKTPSQSN
jgi:hypothetical protein